MPQLDPILLAKAAIVERCVHRAQSALAQSPAFQTDIDAQDIVVLNIIRACEASIDIALRLVRIFDAGLPSSSGDSFTLLAQQGLIDADFAGRLKRMVGFRNVAVHDYTTLNLDIVASVVTESLGDLLVFSGVALSLKIPPELI
jgi:uncharacterized protein YutE (UPF0331/DUF86 family)